MTTDGLLRVARMKQIKDEANNNQPRMRLDGVNKPDTPCFSTLRFDFKKQKMDSK
jgi:hypothetical protein